ncbi:YeiH family protein [Chlorogloea sp. CCALA 695]|uniref:YeiH family protein n=1 Tax=Chlorogloea sp. CCALA 695 TaxID=2107693 RepID=UPI000D050B8A|nr:YeiH family protein [Chlorogloea sp. CCALA 695]PSB27552.1 YeiH family putative sulfate export transporter [Chlorogloea sp. CCALA 695]
MRHSLKLKVQARFTKKSAAIRLQRWLLQILPGVSLTAGLAFLAILMRSHLGLNFFSSLTWAILLGMLVRNTVGVAQVYQPGITFSLKRILKLGIILLGMQLSLTQAISIGSTGLFVAVTSVVSTFFFTCWIGRRLKVSKKLTQLIAGGTSICGAAAVVAVGTAIDSSEEDTAYAVALVTVFGAASMLIYPLLPALLDLTPQAYGLWCGASIHEVVQAIAAAFETNPLSGEVATIAKLSRVMLLAPITLLLGLSSVDRATEKPRKLPIPWFVLGFIGLILVNSLNFIPETLRIAIVDVNQFFLTTALAAMGLGTNIQCMKRLGIKPIYLGTISWLFISLISLGLIKFFY